MPLTNVALTVLATDEPALTERLPALLRAKSKLLTLANHALAIELGLAEPLKALAFSIMSLEIVIGPEYFADD